MGCEAPRENQLKPESGYIGGAPLPVGSWHLPWICRGAAGVGCPRLEVKGFYEYPAVSVPVGQWPDGRHQCLLFPFFYHLFCMAVFCIIAICSASL
jgi:hypothetical protein